VWKKAIFALTPVAALLVLTEAVLRLIGFHSALADPYESFVLHKPLFSVRGEMLKTNPTRLQYFHDQSFARTKPPGTTRFFVFGGSATYGFGLPDPLHDSYATILAQQWGGEPSFEVVNCGGIAYASYRLVGLVEEAMGYAPDFVIVMSGNNEFLEPRHYANLMHSSTVSRFWYSLRLAHLVLELSHRLRATRARGFTSFHRDRWVLEPDVVDERYIVRDEREIRLTLEHYAHNLNRMVDLCNRHGTPVILATVPSNLRDWPPFVTEPHGSLSKEQLGERFTEARGLYERGDFEGCLQSSRAVLAQDARAASFHFLSAQCLEKLHRTVEARNSYLLAKDNDGFPHRALSSFNERIRKIAQQRGVLLFDAEAAFAAASTDGIPGSDLFVDQCHPNQKGHQLLADGLAAVVTREILPKQHR
jgi:hypothetical protein